MYSYKLYDLVMKSMHEDHMRVKGIQRAVMKVVHHDDYVKQPNEPCTNHVVVRLMTTPHHQHHYRFRTRCLACMFG
jgi:hypothetical protein